MSNKKIITVRVSERTYLRYKEKCENERRSMSKQGELLIDEFLGDEDTIMYFHKKEDQPKIKDFVQRKMKEWEGE